jgi:hypothetical protein
MATDAEVSRGHRAACCFVQFDHHGDWVRNDWAEERYGRHYASVQQLTLFGELTSLFFLSFR